MSDLGVIEIFRPGRFTAMNGKSHAFSPAVLHEVADGFNPDTAPAPICAGHPKHDAPAYGWVDSLSVEDGILKAQFSQVDPAFADIVKKGRYKRISPAFYAPTADSNPTPGKWYLRHVGFLGAAAPAVQGLKPVEFAGADDTAVMFAAEALDVIPAAYQHRIQNIENHLLLERLTQEGRFHPRYREDVMCFLASLSAHQTVAFTDSGACSPLDWFCDYLANTPAFVSMGEVVTSTQAPNAITTPAFTAPSGYQVDPEGMDLHAKATRIMKEHGVRFEDAVDLAMEG